MSKNVCPADQDPAFWEPRRCFREPIRAIFRAAGLLDQAVDAHLDGDYGKAKQLIAKADKQEVRAWVESIWGAGNCKVWRVRKVDGMPPTVCCSERDPRKKPSSGLKQKLIDRDGRHCRFCGIPLIRAEVREAMNKCYPNELRWNRTNDSQHAAFQCMWMQFDHVIPHSRRGTTDLDNLIITCSACNYGRKESTLEEVGLIDPRTRSETKPTWKGYETWDGLERFRGC